MMRARKLIKWTVMAALLLAIGIIIGAALDREDSASRGAAVKTGSAPTATPTPTATPESRKTAKARKTTPKPKATKTPAPTPKPPSFIACDANIRVKAATTTCAFAQNVFYEYWYSWNYLELSAFAAYSSAADDWFDMTCTDDTTITCTASDGSEVRFPMSAVLAYTERNADNYSADHIVSATPDEYYAGARSDSEPEYDAAAPNYGGGDVDCGEIADTDFPTPPGDPDGLDADGDGIACES
jgi:hypothetical protein